MGARHTALKAKFATLCEAHGWLCVSLPSSWMTGKGRSDDLVCAEGYYCVVELKTPEDKPDDRWVIQERFRKKVRRAGGFAVSSYSAVAAEEAIQQYLQVRKGRVNANG